MKTTLIFLCLIVAWVVLTHFELVSPVVLPEPQEVIAAYRPSLLKGAVSTTVRALAGLTLGILMAYTLHFVCVVFRVSKDLDAQFAGARAVPVFAILPLFVIWFGFSEVGRLLIVTLSCIAFFAAPLHEAYRKLGREITIIKEQLSLSTFRYYVHIVIPATVGSLLGPLRVTLAVTFTISIASEYVGAQVGIGRFLDSARVTFNVPAIFLAILVSSAIGVMLDQGVRLFHHSFVHWAGKDGKA